MIYNLYIFNRKVETGPWVATLVANPALLHYTCTVLSDYMLYSVLCCPVLCAAWHSVIDPLSLLRIAPWYNAVPRVSRTGTGTLQFATLQLEL